MRYVLLWRGSGPVPVAEASSRLAELNGRVAFFAELARELGACGELVTEQTLAGPEHARWVLAHKEAQGEGAGGHWRRPTLPSEEAFLVAYWVVDCDAPERALEIAERLSAGACFSVEVRPVQRSSGEEM